MIVAIDGPAGSGKSTVARELARRHGFVYLDTGAMYRAVAWRALELGVDVNDEAGLALIAQTDRVEFGRDDAGEQTVSIAGIDVTSQIRTQRVDNAVSSVARVPDVRKEMVVVQRNLARDTDVVCEGRDIGTVVFPQAEVKVFLVASPERRAGRRALQNRERGAQGASTDEAAVLRSIVERDRADSTRALSPLRPAEDAVEIDTSDLTIEQVIARVEELICAARGRE